MFAVVVWILASGAFALYVANFSSYNKTYGTLAGVIIFLVWLWISNVAILLGAELNAELARGRAMEVGPPARDRAISGAARPRLRATAQRSEVLPRARRTASRTVLRLAWRRS